MAFEGRSGGGEAKLPISLHPAFPAVVGLWFAALLGLGSLVVPVILLERVVELTGLAAVLPSASPPLGFTARGLVALVAAVLGGGIGIVLARKVSRAHAPQRVRAIGAHKEGRKPISAHDELGAEGLNGSGGTRRRSLAVGEEGRPSDFLLKAPLPGRADGDTPVQDPVSTDVPEASDALELHEIAGDEPSFDNVAYGPEQDASMTDEVPSQFPTADELERRREQRLLGATTKAQAIAPEITPGAEVEPLPFAAPSLASRAAGSEDTPAGNEDLREVRSDMEPEAPHADFARPIEIVQPMAADEPPAHPWESDPLEELGMLQLVQRLGASIEKRRAQAVAPQAAAPEAPAAPPAVSVPNPVDFEAAAAEEAVKAMAAYFGRPSTSAVEQPMEADAAPEFAPPPPFFSAHALTAFSPDDQELEDDDEVANSFALPIGRAALVGHASDTASGDDNSDFASLLSLRNPPASTREPFVRIEEPAEPDMTGGPVVFPGQEPASAQASVSRLFDPPGAETPQAAGDTQPLASSDTDEALRRALATLQRMSSKG